MDPRPYWFALELLWNQGDTRPILTTHIIIISLTINIISNMSVVVVLEEHCGVSKWGLFTADSQIYTDWIQWLHDHVYYPPLRSCETMQVPVHNWNSTVNLASGYANQMKACCSCCIKCSSSLFISSHYWSKLITCKWRILHYKLN